MNRKEQKDAVNEAYLLEGEIEGLSQEVSKLQTRVREAEGEINKLKNLEIQVDVLQKELSGKKEKLENKKSGLGALLQHLKDDGVILPIASPHLGNQPVNKQVRL